jgi:hypothetical protein
MSEVNDKSAFLAKAGHPLGLSEEQEMEAIAEDTIEQPPIQDEQSSVDDVAHEEEAPSQEEVEKEDSEEQEVFSAFYEEETPEVEEQIQETKISDKVKYNLKDVIEQHSNEVLEYFKYKNLDVDSMSNEDLIRYKLQQENPTWDASDIEEELKSKYGIGLQERVIDEDGLEEDIERDKEYNQRIREKIKQGQRLLKTDVLLAKQLLKEKKENVKLPEVELDVELTADRSKIIEQYNKEIQEQTTKYREEVWSPQISEAVQKLGGFRQKFELEVESGDKVVSDVTYKLTPNQKAQLQEYLVNYVPHPEDNKYVTNEETGEVDFTRFVNDKAKQLFVDDIIKSSIKEAVAQFKATFIKEKVVNYSDEPRRVSKSDDEPKDFAIAQFERRRSSLEAKFGKYR